MRILSRISIRAVGHFLAAKELRNNKKKHKMVEGKNKRDTVVYVRLLLECVFFFGKRILKKKKNKKFHILHFIWARLSISNAPFFFPNCLTDSKNFSEIRFDVYSIRIDRW